MRSRWLLGLVLLAATVGWYGTPGEGGVTRPAHPVAVVLVRDLTWADAPLALDGFAKAGVSMRTVAPRGGAADVYLTLGKGARATGLGERGVGGLELRPGGGVRLTDWPELQEEDRGSRFPGRLGALGQALFESGRDWALVGSDMEAAAVAATASGVVPASHPGTADGLERALRGRPDVVFVATSQGGLSRVVSRLSEWCTLVVSASTPADNRHLGVFAASPSCGLGREGIRSASTHRPDLLTLPDVTATVLRLAGLEVPGPELGAAEGVDRAGLVDSDRRTRTGDRSRPLFVWLFIALHAAGAAAVVRWHRARTAVCCALLAVPAASFLVMVVPWWRAGAAAALLAGAALTAAIAVPAAVLVRRDRLLGVGALAALTAAVVAVDAVFGGPLQVDAPFGNSPVVGARFFGVGNIGSGFLVAGLLIAGGLALDRWGRRALPYVAAALALGTIAAGAPQFGADVGGVLFAVPAYGLLLVGARERRARLSHLVLMAAAALLAVALFTAVDLARTAGEQTHLASAFGGHDLAQQVVRKATLALGTVTNPLGLVGAVALVTLVVTRYSPGSRRAIRSTTCAMVVAAALGSLLNDSGVIVAAAVGALAWPAGVLVASADRCVVDSDRNGAADRPISAEGAAQ